MISHALGAVDGLEAVASILQLHKDSVHGSLNCENVHPEFAPFQDQIVRETQERPINILTKASFGFGDVNTCLIFKR